jgi:esterase/lipase
MYSKIFVLFGIGLFFMGCSNIVKSVHVQTERGHKSCYPNKDNAFFKDDENLIATKVYPYAIMSNNSYQDEEQIPLVGYQFLNRYQANNDFSADVYRAMNGDIVISFRGTELNIKDIQYGTIQDSQIKSAKELYDKIKSYNNCSNIIVTGHSLGGALALDLSMKNKGVDAIVFNTSLFGVNTNKKYENNRILINEKGEFLSKYFHKYKLNKMHYDKRYSQEFNFWNTSRPSLFQHGIYDLARGILLAASKTDDNAKYILHSILDCKKNNDKKTNNN